MATILTHGLAAVALGHAVSGQKRPMRLWVLAAISAMVPDLDVIGFALGIEYGDQFGHRGFSHSIVFALIWSLGLGWVAFKPLAGRTKEWVKTVLLLFMATASHGALDAMTNGGLGVAFFAPFDSTRYFFPWRPIQVSPIGADFFSERGWAVLGSELKFIWLPVTLVWLLAAIIRRWVGVRSKPD